MLAPLAFFLVCFCLVLLWAWLCNEPVPPSGTDYNDPREFQQAPKRRAQGWEPDYRTPDGPFGTGSNSHEMR